MQTKARRDLDRKNGELTASNKALDEQRLRAEDREAQAIAAVKKFGDVIANEPELKKTPALEGLRKRLMNEPLAFFRALRERLQADPDSRPESLSRLAAANVELGNLTLTIGDIQEALTSFREALTIQQKLVDANPSVIHFQKYLSETHFKIGLLQQNTGHPVEALKAYESALPVQRKLATEHSESPSSARVLGRTLNNLAMIDLAALRFEPARVRLREAIALQKKALALNPADPDYRQFLSAHWVILIKAAQGLGDSVGVAEAERELAVLRDSDPAMVALDARLAAILRGDQQPGDNLERLKLAQRAYDRAFHAAAAKLWADALDADPKLAEDREVQTAYNAACAASLAGCGQGKDNPPPDDSAKAKLRERARGWLKTELDVWAKLVESGPAEARTSIAQTLQHWREDSDLAGIRDETSLAKLPEGEREAFRALWADVDRLLPKARAAGPAGVGVVAWGFLVGFGEEVGLRGRAVAKIRDGRGVGFGRRAGDLLGISGEESLAGLASFGIAGVIEGERRRRIEGPTWALA